MFAHRRCSRGTGLWRSLRRIANLAFVTTLCLAGSAAVATPVPSPGAYFEDFPDALSVEATCGPFANLSINGGNFSGNGCHIQIENTSWGDGLASSFQRDPKSDFRGKHGGLSPSAYTAIVAGQSYGIHEIELELAPGSRLLSAPSFLRAEHENYDGGRVEIELEIDLHRHPRGLLFDSAATRIDPLFRDPQTGVWHLFISTEGPDARRAGGESKHGIRGIGLEVEFAWAMDGAVTHEFGSHWGRVAGQGLEVEGMVVPSQFIPEPSSQFLLALGLTALSLHANRRRSRARRSHMPA